MQKLLIIGYGNADRQDDGVAWHILTIVARKMGIPVPLEPGEPFDSGGKEIDLCFTLQLYPEMVEDVKGYDCVVFVDAHTGEIEEEISFSEVIAVQANSPFTHHLAPEMMLAISETIYGQAPKGWLLTVRGYEFSFHHGLSRRTAALAEKAAELLWDWISSKDGECRQ